MIDTKKLRRLAQAVSGWGNCNQTWLDQSEDAPAVVVGHIGEDGETYPVVTIDCDQYYAADQSLPLGKFYAAANPATVIELLDRLEAAENAVTEAYQRGYATGQEEIEKERDALRAKVEAMEQQEPVARVWRCDNGHIHGSCEQALPMGAKLYALPGAQPTPIVPDGWQLVPIEPTLEMLRALIDGANQYDSWNEGYRDMLAAAPEAKPCP